MAGEGPRIRLFPEHSGNFTGDPGGNVAPTFRAHSIWAATPAPAPPDVRPTAHMVPTSSPVDSHLGDVRLGARRRLLHLFNAERIVTVRRLAVLTFVALLNLPTATYSQEGASDIEILSKDDARAMFAMTRAQWVENVRRAVIAGVARAMGSPETALAMATTTPTGVLFVKPDFSGEGRKPDFIQVTVGYRYPKSALLTDSALNDAVQASKKQMEPEYEVIGNVERIQGEVAIFFIITEKKR